MNIKKLIFIIGILLIIGIIVLLVLLGMLSMQKEQENKTNYEIGTEMTEEEYKELDKEDGDYTVQRNDSANVKRADYGGVQNCMQRYLDMVNMENSAYYGYDEKGNYTQIVSKEEIQSKIMNIVSSKWIEENQIKGNNLWNFIDTIKESFLFSILEINHLQTEEGVKSFAVHVIAQSITNDKLLLDQYFIVNLDDNHLTFSIEPRREITEITQMKLNDKIEEIKPNDDNQFQYKNMANVDIIGEYINTYKNVSFVYPEYVYDKLQEDYREKRFGNLQGFQNYITEHKEEIKRLNIEKYQIDNTNTLYTQYICIDTQGRNYIIKETSMGKYHMILDTYTIDLPEFIAKYNSSTEEQKVLLNIQKCFEAINQQDYQYVYNKLDETFRNNNFKTLAEFEVYAKKNFFSKNKLAVGKAGKQGSIYLYDITISDSTGKDTVTKKKNFVMQLKEGTDFVMSFEI